MKIQVKTATLPPSRETAVPAVWPEETRVAEPGVVAATGPGTTLTAAAAESGNEGAAGVVIVAEAPPEFVTVIVAVNESPSGSVCGMARVAESCEGVCTVTGDDVFGVAVMALWSVESVPLAFAVSVREPAALGV